MGYTGEKKKEYSKKWIAKRRHDFFRDKKCAECSSEENLELHHTDPNEKESHNIWSWSEQRRNEELKKCIIMCKKCHRKITNKYLSKIKKGVPNIANRKLNSKQVIEIRKLKSEGYTLRKLAEMYGVAHKRINELIQGRTYFDVV